MAQAIIPFNPALVNITWGPYNLSAGTADDMATISFDENAITKTVGSQGEIALTVNQNRGGLAKVTMMQGSPIQALLSSQCASVRGRRAPIILLPFTIIDEGGTALAVGPNAYIEKIPDISRKKANGNNEWTFNICEWTKLSNGGVATQQPSGSIISSLKGLLPSF